MDTLWDNSDVQHFHHHRKFYGTELARLHLSKWVYAFQSVHQGKPDTYFNKVAIVETWELSYTAINQR